MFLIFFGCFGLYKLVEYFITKQTTREEKRKSV